MAKELSWGVSLEGLCALLNALERLALLDLSLAISPAAVQRVSHAKLSASHLGHLCASNVQTGLKRSKACVFSFKR